MFLKQFYLGCLSHASYLIADERTKKAAVVDPQRDVDQYLTLGYKIEHVILTHFHADFVSGHLELQKRTGAKIYLGAKAKAAYKFTPLKNGDAISLGDVTLRALETPGHTPEAICILAGCKAVLTGDTLFVGDVGRPDLMASKGVSARTLAGQLYDSLHQKLMTLPDETLVYPAHGAGSLCGKNLGSESFSTIGKERRYNYALQPMSKAKFIKLVSDQPKAPAYFSYDAELNRSKRPMLKTTFKALTAKQALKAPQILDTRDPADFARGHLPGSVNVGLGGKFASFCGMVLDPRKPVAVVAELGKEAEAVTRLARVGFDKIEGVLDARAAEGEVLRRFTAAELKKTKIAMLDVRTPGERKAAFIPGSKHIPLLELPKRMKEVPKKGPLLVYCAGGYRSAIAASLIMKSGRKDVSDLEGGFAAWQEAR